MGGREADLKKMAFWVPTKDRQCHTITCLALARLSVAALPTDCLRTICKLTASFFKAVSVDQKGETSYDVSSLFSCATQILTLRWGLNAREEIQPGDCFDIVGHSPGKPFCSVTECVLDLEPLAPRLKHLI